MDPWNIFKLDETLCCVVTSHMENMLGVGGELFESWLSWDTLLSKDTADVIFV